MTTKAWREECVGEIAIGSRVPLQRPAKLKRRDINGSENVHMNADLERLPPSFENGEAGGSPVGVVAEEEVKGAQAILAERKARTKARGEAKKRAAAAPPSPAKVRLSLDKLREAARQRSGAVA